MSDKEKSESLSSGRQSSSSLKEDMSPRSESFEPKLFVAPPFAPYPIKQQIFTDIHQANHLHSQYLQSQHRSLSPHYQPAYHADSDLSFSPEPFLIANAIMNRKPLNDNITLSVKHDNHPNIKIGDNLQELKLMDEAGYKRYSPYHLLNLDQYERGKATFEASYVSNGDGKDASHRSDQRVTRKGCKVNQNRYQCSECNKSYSTYSGLSKHKEFHCSTQVKKLFNCKHCDKTYASLGALKMHIRTHTLPCLCKLCGKAFSRPWLLQGTVFITLSSSSPIYGHSFISLIHHLLV